MHRRSPYILVLAVMGLMALGFVMLFSTSAFANDTHGDVLYFIKRQGVWILLSGIACVVCSLVDYHFWQRTWWMWFAIAAVLLVLCFIKPIGLRIGGSSRWITLRVANFQPSELAKLAAVVFTAHWYTRHELQSATFLRGFVAPLAVVSVLLGLIVFEVDLGSTALIGGTTLLMMFVAGAHPAFLLPAFLSAPVGLIYVAMRMPERLRRLMAFLDLEGDPAGSGYQQLQGLIALGSGGVEGLGLGNGRQKHEFLPEAHTDFILPVIGEELGVYVTLLIVLGYVLIMLSGGLIALHSRDRFGMLLAFGLTAVVALQAVVNIGVTTALLPNKGLPLPFISYGGSNLIFCLCCVGILLNIHRQGILRAVINRKAAAHSRVMSRI